MKKPQLSPRTPASTRFQTAVGGLTWVPTVMQAHFDAYTETAPAPGLSRDVMETVPRVAVTGNATAGQPTRR